MEEFIKTTEDDQAYKIPNSSRKYPLNMLTAIPGARQSSNTAVTINMSIATIFSRLNVTEDAFCPETAFCTCLFWRRIAMKIPMWFTIGTMINIVPTTRPRASWTSPSGRIQRISIVNRSQVIPVRKTALTASVEKKKKPILCIVHEDDDVEVHDDVMTVVVTRMMMLGAGAHDEHEYR